MLSSQRGHREITAEYRKLLRWTDRRVDGIVVNCQYMKRHLMDDEQVPERLIRLCYNGIDLQHFVAGRGGRPPSLPPGAFVVGVVSGLRSEKGIDILIDAFARVRALRPGMKLAMVGSGKELQALEEQAKRAGVFEDCVWQPATPDVATWLRNIDIFVLPSLNEALSNALMEAMACGCAVVASRVGGNPELIRHGETGLLFESGNTAALAEALTILIEDEELRRRLAAGGERSIRENFSRQASIQEMGRIYDSFLARRRS